MSVDENTILDNETTIGNGGETEMEQGIAPYNYFNDLEWMKNCYYVGGTFTPYEGVICTRPIKLFPGLKIKLSSFYKAENAAADVKYGIRISFWKDGKWISDIDAVSTRDVEYVTIPENCNSVSLALRESDDEKYVYLYVENMNERNDLIYYAIKQKFDTNCSFYGKSISILGDSISTYGKNDDTGSGDKFSDGTYTTEGNRVRYPQDSLNLTDVHDTWWMRLIERNHMELITNEAWAGSRVAWDGQSEDGIYQGANIYMGSPTRISRLEKNGKKPDIIMVFAGTNDINHGSKLEPVDDNFRINFRDEEVETLEVDTFTKAYNAMLVRIKRAYPTSRIICVLPYYTTDYNAQDSTILQKVDADRTDAYDDTMKKICDLHKITYVDLREADLPKCMYKKYFPDNIHPNPKGMEAICKMVNQVH